MTGTRLGKTGAKHDPTCGSIAWLDAKEIRSKSFAQTFVKAELIDVKCVVIGTSCGRIGVTYAETFAISGATGVTLAETNQGSVTLRKGDPAGWVIIQRGTNRGGAPSSLFVCRTGILACPGVLSRKRTDREI